MAYLGTSQNYATMAKVERVYDVMVEDVEVKNPSLSLRHLLGVAFSIKYDRASCLMVKVEIGNRYRENDVAYLPIVPPYLPNE